VELDALEHGALEAFDLLGGCSNGEADDLLVLLEEVELLGVTVDEVINLINDDEVTFFGLEYQVIVVVDVLLEVSHVEVLF
jgi:hypothetical protein